MLDASGDDQDDQGGDTCNGDAGVSLEGSVIVMTFWYVFWNGLTFFLNFLNFIFTWD